MNNLLKKLAYLVSGSLMTINSSALAQEPQRYVTGYCDFVNYMITIQGDCVNLDYLVNPSSSPDLQSSTLVSRFQSALAQINVPIKYLDCPSEPGVTLFGYYDSMENTMVICPVARKNKQQLEKTLIHESWHTVQDCIGGKDNSQVVALSEEYPEIFQDILGGITVKDFSNVMNLYPDEQKITEIEARYMQDKPDIVLKGLGVCRKK